jgi:hypothetical protein
MGSQKSVRAAAMVLMCRLRIRCRCFREQGKFVGGLLILRGSIPRAISAAIVAKLGPSIDQLYPGVNFAQYSPMETLYLSAYI